MLQPESVSAYPQATDILASLPVALLLIDNEGVVREVSAATEALFNRSAGALVGQKMDRIVTLPPEFSGDQDSDFAVYDTEMTLQRGKRIRGDLHASLLADFPGWRIVTIAHGRPGATGPTQDRRGGSRTAIAIGAMLAHEIKNPLAGISGAAQLLDGRVEPGDAALTRLIRTEVDRVAALIDRMEGFTDTRPIQLSAQNIHAIIDHSRSVVEQGFRDRISVSGEYDPSLPPVLAHRDSLIQVIINLIKNAAETAEAGALRNIRLVTRYRHGVAVATRDRDVRRVLPIELAVMDDGPGAPPELADQLFDPFVSSKRSGQGLGLALADKLMRDMGGLIQYAREGDPPCTIFRLLLQRAEGTAE